MRRAGGLAEPPPRPCGISHLLPPPPPAHRRRRGLSPDDRRGGGRRRRKGEFIPAEQWGRRRLPGDTPSPSLSTAGAAAGPRRALPPPRPARARPRLGRGTDGAAEPRHREGGGGSARFAAPPAASATPLPPPAGRPHARTVLVATVAAAALRLRVVPVGGAAALGAVGGCPALSPQELRALLHRARHARAGSGGERRQRWLRRGGKLIRSRHVAPSPPPPRAPPPPARRAPLPRRRESLRAGPAGSRRGAGMPPHRRRRGRGTEGRIVPGPRPRRCAVELTRPAGPEHRGDYFPAAAQGSRRAGAADPVVLWTGREEPRPRRGRAGTGGAGGARPGHLRAGAAERGKSVLSHR